MQCNGFLQTEIADGKHIGPREIENHEHLGGPAADAFDLDQFRDQVFVAKAHPAFRLQAAIIKARGEIENVAGLLSGESASAQRFDSGAGDDRRRNRLMRCGEPVPYALRGLHRNLLADDSTRERLESVPAAAEREAFVPCD